MLVATQEAPSSSRGNLKKRPPKAAAVEETNPALVGARGFEPPTSRSQTERTTRLCYAPYWSANLRPSLRRRLDILASAGSAGQVLQVFARALQGARSMTDLVFGVWLHLREG